MKKQAASLFDSDDDDLFGSPRVVPEARSSNAKAGEPSKVNISVVLASNYWILAWILLDIGLHNQLLIGAYSDKDISLCKVFIKITTYLPLKKLIPMAI